SLVNLRQTAKFVNCFSVVSSESHNVVSTFTILINFICETTLAPVFGFYHSTTVISDNLVVVFYNCLLVVFVNIWLDDVSYFVLCSCHDYCTSFWTIWFLLKSRTRSNGILLAISNFSI